jgi:enoyl-CoA hydratase
VTVVMNHPPVNAMSSVWVSAFTALLDRLEKREDWSVLHIRSALQVFSAGADLKEMLARIEGVDSIDAQIAAVQSYQTLFARLEALPRVTLAEIGGTALGGGFELALACDLRIAAQEAQLGLPELRLGLLPGAGGTQRLTWLCGRAIAQRLILGAEILDGGAAAQLGLVQWSTSAALLPEEAAAIARRYAALPQAATAAAKCCIAAASDPDQDGFAVEREKTRALLQRDGTLESLRAFITRPARGKRSN